MNGTVGKPFNCLWSIILLWILIRPIQAVKLNKVWHLNDFWQRRKRSVYPVKLLTRQVIAWSRFLHGFVRAVRHCGFIGDFKCTYTKHTHTHIHLGPDRHLWGCSICNPIYGPNLILWEEFSTTHISGKARQLLSYRLFILQTQKIPCFT